MKRQLHIIAIYLLMVAALSSCADKLFNNGSTFNEGEVTECLLGVSVGDFQVVSGSMTRAASKTASDQEKKIDNIWVFQYDASGNLLIKPRYYTSDSQNSDGSWNVLLNVSASTIYVVTNTSDATWASDASGFATLEELKANSLSEPYPIQVEEGTKHVDADKVYIPMSGSQNVETSAFSSTIEIPVERMYAKLIIKAEMLKDITLKSIAVTNIPYTCRIESESSGINDETVLDYGEKINSVAYDITANNSTTTNTESNTTNESGETTTTDGSYTSKDYVLYVPECIKGVCSDYIADGGTLKGRDYNDSEHFPKNPLTVTYSLDVAKTTGEETTQVPGSANIYPGANNTNNFNVNRNYVYEVTAQFNDKNYFFPTPSSNCFVVKPGETLEFYPYYRTETGGGYTFRDYLDPTVTDKAISSVKIIWQDKGVIGDNSDENDKKVSYIVAKGVNKDDYQQMIENSTITVKTQNKGNALIGAYNSQGDIIWSWHIWVTDLDPGNVGKAIRYTTYDWDATSGIKTTAARVPGYQVMPCNLGAMALQNTGTNSMGNLNNEKARGMLYQWGRKDPFPPVLWKENNGTSNYEDAYAGVHYGNDNETKVGKTSGNDKTFLFHTESGKDITGTVKYAIAHPTVFMAGVEEKYISNQSMNSDCDALNKGGVYFNNGDWCNNGESDNKLWGAMDPEDENIKNDLTSYQIDGDIYIYKYKGSTDEFYGSKSIFDPCPTGWRVPPGDLWMGFTSTGKNPTESSTSKDSWMKWVNFDVDKSGSNKGNQMYMYLNGWQTGDGSYFPTQGPRLGDGRGIRWNSCGNYHSATTGTKNRINALHMHIYGGGDVNLFNVFENRIYGYHVKSVAGPIRCVRDKK